MGTIEKLKHVETDSVVVVDDQGIITFVNSLFESLFEWTSVEIVGKPLATIIPAHLRDAHNLGFSRFLSTEQPTLLEQPLNLPAVKKSGLEFNCTHIIFAEKINGAWEFAATLKHVDGAKK